MKQLFTAHRLLLNTRFSMMALIGVVGVFRKTITKLLPEFKEEIFTGSLIYYKSCCIRFWNAPTTIRRIKWWVKAKRWNWNWRKLVFFISTEKKFLMFAWMPFVGCLRFTQEALRKIFIWNGRPDLPNAMSLSVLCTTLRAGDMI